MHLYGKRNLENCKRSQRNEQAHRATSSNRLYVSCLLYDLLDCWGCGVKTRKELLLSFYAYHRAQAHYHLEHENNSMLMHHFGEMQKIGEDYRKLLAAEDAGTVNKVSIMPNLYSGRVH